MSVAEAIAVKERPILFSGPMVRCVLEGCKRQTRRVMNPQPHKHVARFIKTLSPEHWMEQYDNGDQLGVLTGKPLQWTSNGSSIKCQYGAPGDHLWVRETAYRFGETGEVFYKADMMSNFGSKVYHWNIWKPSIHMRRVSSRITLEIIKIRAERIQNISFDDCLAEGVIHTDYWDKVKGADIARLSEQHPKEWSVDESIAQSWIDYTRLAFQSLWDSINEKRGFGWDANPWVWVIEFRRIP